MIPWNTMCPFQCCNEQRDGVFDMSESLTRQSLAALAQKLLHFVCRVTIPLPELMLQKLRPKHMCQNLHKVKKYGEVTDPQQTSPNSDQPLFLWRARMIQSRIHRRSLGAVKSPLSPSRLRAMSCPQPHPFHMGSTTHMSLPSCNLYSCPSTVGIGLQWSCLQALEKADQCLSSNLWKHRTP